MRQHTSAYVSIRHHTRGTLPYLLCSASQAEEEEEEEEEVTAEGGEFARCLCSLMLEFARCLCSAM